MTKEEAILISAYTGYFLTKDWSDVHALCEKVLGRPIFSHEFAAEEVHAEIREKLRPMLNELRCDDEYVKRGQWRPDGSCTNCGCVAKWPNSDFCPHCGARMREGHAAEE